MTFFLARSYCRFAGSMKWKNRRCRFPMSTCHRKFYRPQYSFLWARWKLLWLMTRHNWIYKQATLTHRYYIRRLDGKCRAYSVYKWKSGLFATYVNTIYQYWRVRRAYNDRCISIEYTSTPLYLISEHISWKCLIFQ